MVSLSAVSRMATVVELTARLPAQSTRAASSPSDSGAITSVLSQRAAIARNCSASASPAASRVRTSAGSRRKSAATASRIARPSRPSDPPAPTAQQNS